MAATPEQVRKAINTYVEAWTTNNKELLLSIFAKDASWSDPVGTPPFVGHEGISAFWEFARKDKGRQLSPKVNRMAACGNEGVLDFIMQVRIPALNQGLNIHCIDRFVLNDEGKIQIAQAYWDESCVSAPPGMELFMPNMDEAYDK
jgi:steroid delta-isomerase